MVLLSPYAVPRPDTKSLQSIESVAVLEGHLRTFEESLWAELPGIRPVILAVICAVMLDFDKSLEMVC